MARLIRRVIGSYRMLWGWCPRCNSDAPHIYTCAICKSEGWQFSDRTQEVVWRRFVDAGCEIAK